MQTGTPSYPPAAFPLQISANHRYLVDREGRPFLVHGDTAWSIITGITWDEANQYLENRAAKNYNAIIVNLIEHKFNGPLTRTGEHPFKDPRDLATPNDKYFDYAEKILERAQELGILVILCAMYLGYKHPHNNDGWYQEARLTGPQGCYEYGAYIGQRYSRFNNILWMMGGDRNPDGVVEEVNSLVMGIKSVDKKSLFTAHPHPDEPAVDRYGWGGWMDLNQTYTYQIVHSKLLMDYNRRPVMPFVLMETAYEGEHNCPPVQIRRQAYWANLCGAGGQFLGNNPIWLFNPGWKEAIESTGSKDMVHVRRFFESRPWCQLVPDQRHEVVTGGVGEYRGLDYLAAALTADGATLMAYMPTARQVTVDLSKISGDRTRAWWFDPRTGQSTEAGAFPASGQQTLTPPGDGDWGLVIDDAAKNLPAPGIVA